MAGTGKEISLFAVPAFCPLNKRREKLLIFLSLLRHERNTDIIFKVKCSQSC